MDALLIAVFNALWQGAALIALVALALRAGLRRNATTACVVWSITFAVVALLPAIDIALARPASVRTPAPAPESIALAAAEPAAAVRAVRAAPVRPSVSDPVQLADRPYRVASAAAPVPAGDSLAVQFGGIATAFAHAWGIVLLVAWALVAGVLLLRLTLAYAAVGRMKRAATPLGDPVIEARLRAAGHRRRATVARSARVEIPCAIGFLRPMILIPSRLADSLDADDLARIVLHESAHLQRYDDWINALEQLVCALQFFQPALYVARRRIDFEREVACDDRVLEDAGEPLRYAECLARIVQRHVRGRQAAVVPGFVLRRTQVVARVRRIVDRSRDASPHLRIGAAVLGGVVMIATLGIARVQVPLVAAASAEPAIPAAVPAAPVFVLAAPPVDRPVAAVSPAPPVRALAAPRARHSVTAARVPKAAHVAAVPRRAMRPVASVRQTPALAPVPEAPLQQVLPIVVPEVRSVHVEVETASGIAPEAYAVVARVRALAAEAAIAPAVRVRALPGDAEAPTPVVHVVQPIVQPVVHVVPFLTMARFGHGGGDILDAIDEAKYPHPSVDELIALRNQGVTADYIRRMGALGRDRPSLHELMALAVQGVTPEYVRSLMEAGMRNVTPAQLAALRTQGVDGAFVRRLAQHGYRNLSFDEIVRLKVSGFEP